MRCSGFHIGCSPRIKRQHRITTDSSDSTTSWIGSKTIVAPPAKESHDPPPTGGRGAPRVCRSLIPAASHHRLVALDADAQDLVGVARPPIVGGEDFDLAVAAVAGRLHHGTD